MGAPGAKGASPLAKVPQAVRLRRIARLRQAGRHGRGQLSWPRPRLWARPWRAAAPPFRGAAVIRQRVAQARISDPLVRAGALLAPGWSDFTRRAC